MGVWPDPVPPGIAVTVSVRGMVSPGATGPCGAGDKPFPAGTTLL